MLHQSVKSLPKGTPVVLRDILPVVTRLRFLGCFCPGVLLMEKQDQQVQLGAHSETPCEQQLDLAVRAAAVCDTVI